MTTFIVHPSQGPVEGPSREENPLSQLSVPTGQHHSIPRRLLHTNGEALVINDAIPSCSGVGQETAVLAVHGLGSHRHAGFSRRVELLSLTQKVPSRRIGLRGHDPDSSGDGTTITLTRAIEDIELALTDLQSRGVQQFVIAASSFGAQAALIAAQRRDDIKNLILLAPVTDCFQSVLKSRFTDQSIEQWKLQRSIQYPVSVRQTIELGFCLYEDIVSLEPTIDYELISSSIDAFIMGGDEILDPGSSSTALDGLSNCKVITYPGVPHSPTMNHHKALVFSEFDRRFREILSWTW